MEGGRLTDGPLRVLVADNHTMFRQGLARLLDSHDGIEVVAWVPNDDEVPELARELRPDVVVMEVRVGLEEAGASLYAIRAISQPPKVIIVTMIEDPAMMRAFLRLGASGYVPKSSSTARSRGHDPRDGLRPRGRQRGRGRPRGRRGCPLPRRTLPRRTSVRTGQTAATSPSGTYSVRGTALTDGPGPTDSGCKEVWSANFREPLQGEVRGITLPRTRVNRGE